LKAFLSKHWFFIGIAVVSLAAFLFPAVGPVVKKYKILNIGIFLAFLITGLTLDTRTIMDQLKNIRVLLAALLSSLFLIPLFTWMTARLVFPDMPDFIIGATIIAAAPVTIASGTPIEPGILPPYLLIRSRNSGKTLLDPCITKGKPGSFCPIFSITSNANFGSVLNL